MDITWGALPKTVGRQRVVNNMLGFVTRNSTNPQEKRRSVTRLLIRFVVGRGVLIDLIRLFPDHPAPSWHLAVGPGL